MENKNIVDLLKQADTIYYNGTSEPIMSDTEYDRMKTLAKKDLGNDPYFKEVGASVLSGNKVKLPYVMGSLDKVGPDEIAGLIGQWGDDIIATEKLDGSSILVTWTDGLVTFAATRGNGTIGQDITEKAKVFVPQLPVTGIITMRGEALLMGNSNVQLGMKNRRNGVAGILNRDDVDEDTLKAVVPVFYELIDGPYIPDTEFGRLQYIYQVGLNTPICIIPKPGDNFVDILNKMLYEVKQDCTYDIDGIVITQNKSTRQNVKIPTNKIAYKVNDDAVRVNVIGIEWNVSKGGKIIPTVLIEPTDISGSTISRTTGFNAEFIMSSGIGKDAVIGLVKAGQIIPYITDVFTKAPIDEVITECPSCCRPVAWKGVDLVCTDPDECIDAQIKKTAFFFKKMGAEYITETTIGNLHIASIEEAYELDELDIAEIDGFGIKKAEQIFYEISKTLKTTPAKLLAAFSIDGIGETIATQIVGQVNDFRELFGDIDLTDVIGPLTSEKFYNNIHKYEGLYNYLLSIGLTFVKSAEGELSGKTIALTGTGPVKRNELVKMIQNKGGQVKTVSKSTDLLVAEDVSSGSGKIKNAMKYGIKVISYDELLEMLQ